MDYIDLSSQRLLPQNSIEMASIARLAGRSAKRICLRPKMAKSTAFRPPARAFSALPARCAEPYEGTKLIPTDEHFAQ